MTANPPETLTDLADQLSEEFDSHRQPDEFKELSLVIEDGDEKPPTLIVHVDLEDASSLVDSIEDFLQEHGARTERERHSQSDVRILATLD
jgi:hypothetical protein